MGEGRAPVARGPRHPPPVFLHGPSPWLTDELRLHGSEVEGYCAATAWDGGVWMSRQVVTDEGFRDPPVKVRGARRGELLAPYGLWK